MVLVGLLTNRVGREDLSPGDHIYTWRAAYTYTHHGIYAGDEKVIHFTCGEQETGTGTVIDRILEVSTLPRHQIICEQCHGQNTRDGVLLSCLGCFLSGGDLYRFRYSVSTAVFLAQVRGGTCTLAVSDPHEDVVHRATYLLQHGFGTYNIVRNNCEDFAKYCKTGLLSRAINDMAMGGSGQLSSLVSVAVSVPLWLLKRNPFTGQLLTMAGQYCINRYISEISILKNAVRISVESLVEQLGSDRSEASVSGS